MISEWCIAQYALDHTLKVRWTKYLLNWTAENDLLLKNAHILDLPHFFQLGTIFHSGHI